ncbi:hypothetical protein POJ06DRAFT_253332 [Lipomyces tetrasporus]|uniref:Uncharacterized protein n=1 Tax=Lipomyces tetrasporus TaxID=54092 RepID=A0AAD7QSS1_9ASCO|nr:uncharacterized protein POJ06DRAFT_253332 [Lipomyces tetrasporus]KAJ8100651.1 hypothetical protein POJ06DRAFT_253332 [Lipomyces tetrasporus]
MSSTLHSQPSQLWQSSYMISDQPEKPASPRPQPSAPTRRLSWIHNISHKFSTHSSTPATESAVGQLANSRRNSVDKHEPETESASTLVSPQVSPVEPVEPKPGFFSSLRRMSSSSRSHGPSSECRRVVFNKNTSRPVCPVNELRCMKMKRVAFRVDEIDDETISKEPLYIQIRRAIKHQEAVLERKRQAIAAAVNSRSGSSPTSLDAKAAVAGLDGSRCVAKPCVPDKAILFLDGPVEIPKGVMSTIRSASLATVDEPGNGCQSSAASSQSSDSDRRPSVASTSSSSSNSSSDETSESSVSAAPDLGSVYVRCCKLRELRPLDLYYDQIRGHTESVESVRLSADGRDPPAYAQVQALADFLACVPVENFHMDNVALADDMVKPLMASLVSSKSLEFLTLANTKLNAAGWKSVCYLIAMNKSLEKVDLSGIRRKNSEWAILSKAIEARGADNLVGVDLTDTDIPPAELERIKAM